MNTAPKLTVMSDTCFIRRCHPGHRGAVGGENLQQRHPGAAARQPDHQSGEFITLLGPSGCGKSTLLEDGRRPGGAQRRQADAVAARQSGKAQHPLSFVFRKPP